MIKSIPCLVFTLDRYLVAIRLAYTRWAYTWRNVQLVGRTLESGGALSSLAKGATRQKSTEHYSSRQKSATAKAPTVLHKT